MNESATPLPSIHDFIQRWTTSGAAERANAQSFLKDLCDQIGVPHPDPAGPDDEHNAYVFERAVTFQNGDGTTSPGWIDLYKRGCFVLEAKQGSEKNDGANALFADVAKRPKRKGTAVRGTRGWDDAMLKARGQAEQYAKALPASEGWPPFLIVVDIGHSFELYADFTRSGKTYLPFPDARSHRFLLGDLLRDDLRARLKLIWTDPLSLDPSRRSAKITREVATRLAALAKSLEESGHAPETVAAFLMRCIFTMFAEDVKLIPQGRFTELLESLLDDVGIFPQMIESLWQTMNAGGFSPILKTKLLQFNGGLFENCEALPISKQQLELLLDASRSDWHDVEPAIFGTLLERALDPVERHKLGAHYTPRAYVERLVMPTIIEPLREEWNAVKAAAVTLARNGDLDKAVDEVKAFHRRLCETRVLDPACGSGNFLYVTLEHLKRLEGEVISALDDFGERQGVFELELLTVDPHQLLGLEVNPRAAAIADLVLWIGYLQWHFRTRGDAAPREPVLRKFCNIECRDAVLAYDRREIVRDEHGEPVTRWDGRTYKKHPVTGEDVPDENAQVPLYVYVNARKAEWPEADYVIGNPPFIGNKRMRFTLGDGYAATLRETYADVPDTVDYVMYWWNQAAAKARFGKIKQFGFITTNSITQTFNRKVIETYTSEGGISLRFAIPDHPWVDTEDGAAVRIAMTVATSKSDSAGKATLGVVISEIAGRDDDPDAVNVEIKYALIDKINPDLSGGADVGKAISLTANEGLSNQGVTPVGEGFRLSTEEVKELGFGLEALPTVIKRYVIGKDLVQTPERRFIIDFFGLSLEEAQASFPKLLQIVIDEVKPEREQNKRDQYRKKWWIFAEPRAKLRPVIFSIPRYIATCRTSKHRTFTFLSREDLPDTKIVAIGLSDPFFLGVLSSRTHFVFSRATGGWLGIGNDSTYNSAD
ncbi:MAG TPA: DNA methyltransferase [Blastocatellia bacterium]|nr:DNA methyltransferase [Blastocatellia bacterium]